MIGMATLVSVPVIPIVLSVYAAQRGRNDKPSTAHDAMQVQPQMPVATRNAANTADVPALSEETKVKLLLAQHDFDQTQIRYAQVQQQCQQQGTQLNAEAGKEFQALEALKESAYTEAHADKSAWTLTDKMEFAPAPKPPAATAVPAPLGKP